VYSFLLSERDEYHRQLTIKGRETAIAITNGKLDFGTWIRVNGL
jgi:thiamine phosphate synthase YjbQ (UPF0047 family)